MDTILKRTLSDLGEFDAFYTNSNCKKYCTEKILFNDYFFGNENNEKDLELEEIYKEECKNQFFLKFQFKIYYVIFSFYFKKRQQWKK